MIGAKVAARGRRHRARRLKAADRIAMHRIAPALVLLALAAGPAAASQPVPRTITACVVGGAFTGSRYVYRVHVLAAGERRPVDLAPFEGMTLRIKGYLLPGDHLTLRSLEIVADTCLAATR